MQACALQVPSADHRLPVPCDRPEKSKAVLPVSIIIAKCTQSGGPYRACATSQGFLCILQLPISAGAAKHKDDKRILPPK